MVERIDIKLYSEPIASYDIEFIEFCDTNHIKLRPLSSHIGQAYALMTSPTVRNKLYVTRSDANEFFSRIGIETDDAIQAFNKDIGIARHKIRGKYCCIYPFCLSVSNPNWRKEKGLVVTNKLGIISLIKEWWQRNLVDVPSEEWHQGHLDPNIYVSEGNMSWQPPIQASYRNRYKFDYIFNVKWPTGQELCDKFDKFYTQEEQLIIYETLKYKFENRNN